MLTQAAGGLGYGRVEENSICCFSGVPPLLGSFLQQLIDSRQCHLSERFKVMYGVFVRGLQFRCRVFYSSSSEFIALAFLQRSQSYTCLKPKGHQTLLYFYFRAIFTRFEIRFWDNNLQFWPERLQILNKWGRNFPFLYLFLVIFCFLLYI